MQHTTLSYSPITRRCLAFVTLIVSMTFTVGVHAKKVGGFETPDTIDVAGETLTLNGAGLRTKLVIKVYVGALYLAQASQDAAAIVAADESMAIRLQVRSGLLNREKMQTALLDGFKKSTKGNTAPIQAEIDQMMGYMNESIEKKDIYLLAYNPDSGTVLSKNGTEVGTIPGLVFKQALFGIWLSDSPVQAKLKKSMLGQ